MIGCILRVEAVRALSAQDCIRLRVCYRCARPLEGRRQRWCSDACVDAYFGAHSWTTARHLALRRSSGLPLLKGDGEWKRLLYMPSRLQRRRTKGWRMPEGAIYVGRPSRWGNQWAHGRRATRVALFREEVLGWNHDYRMRWLEPLRGRDLACWCPLCDVHADGLPLGVECPDCPPCHATCLLEMANT